jgi:Leucine-rich repeat (LRR) protein
MMLSRRIWIGACLAPVLRAGDTTDWIAGLGGAVRRDSAGNVIAINLGATWINDLEMLDLLAYRKLQRLDLSHTRISDEGLLRLKPASQIEDLNLLYAEQITDLGVSAIRNWRKLKKLNVRGTRIADETMQIAGELRQLEFLDVANTNITDNGLENLAPLTGLKHLSLGRSRLSESAMGILGVLSTLESLDLSGPRTVARNQRGRAGGPMPDSLVSAMSELKELRALKLGYSEIDASGLRRLAVLERVEKLGLECCPRVDDRGLKELAAWQGLRYLDVQETRTTDTGIADLRAARPDIQVLSGPSKG